MNESNALLWKDKLGCEARLVRLFRILMNGEIPSDISVIDITNKLLKMNQASQRQSRSSKKAKTRMNGDVLRWAAKASISAERNGCFR